MGKKNKCVKIIIFEVLPVTTGSYDEQKNCLNTSTYIGLLSTKV